MEKNVCIVNFNTPELTRAAILSLWKNTPDAKVTVFDNSDKRPFVPMDNVSVINNTKGQVIDFDEFLDRFPDKLNTTNNNWGSAKHCYTIKKLWDYFPGGFVLMDSDVLVKKDISEFFDKTVAFSGQRYVDKNRVYSRNERLLPFICWINVPMCRRYGISYFDEIRNWKLISSTNPDDWYDTGSSFLIDCMDKNLPYKDIDISDCIIHFGGGSHSKYGTFHKWLSIYKDLYMDKKEEKPTCDKYMVLIPFFKGGAQGRELEFSVAGIRRHFKEPYHIVIVGDYHPVVDTGDDITFIECERVPEQSYENYRPHIDFVKKFKATHKAFPDSKGFVYYTDDLYAVNDFDIIDVKTLRQQGKEIDASKTNTAWERERCKTRALLEKEGYPTRNFVTHIPMWIEWDKLEALWEKYDMEHNSYIFEDLYFNIYYPTRVPLQLHIDHDNYKCGVYRPNPRLEYIDRAFKNKVWIQNSVDGWIPALEQRLQKYYGI